MNVTYSASVALPDGRTVAVHIEVPEGFRDAGEHGEVAQMGAMHVINCMERAKERQMRAALERAVELNGAPF